MKAELSIVSSHPRAVDARQRIRTLAKARAALHACDPKRRLYALRIIRILLCWRVSNHAA